jgi:pantoate--beta-alanine ligase
MIVISTVAELQKQISAQLHFPLGLVPTMGALHEGHLSLVKNGIIHCPMLVVSIYVNPTQFNDKEDLRNYPRTIEKDFALLKTTLRENDIVFVPEDIEIYPEEDKRVFHFGNLDNVMEALGRPGHFNGVAKVVSRLFDIIKPDIAFFGQKDFQQVAIIKELVRQTGTRIRIITNPIVREEDGLAMSSRNRLIEPWLRKNTSIIYKALSGASLSISDLDIPEIKARVYKTIEQLEGFRVEYFEIVDEKELKPVNNKNEMKSGNRYFGCIAVKAGKIRLIDNIEFPLH